MENIRYYVLRQMLLKNMLKSHTRQLRLSLDNNYEMYD